MPGFVKPFCAYAVAYIALNSHVLKESKTVRLSVLQSLETTRPPRDRDVEADKARARSRQRFEFGGA